MLYAKMYNRYESKYTGFQLAVYYNKHRINSLQLNTRPFVRTTISAQFA